jgi:hypothetical protein
MNDHIGGGRGRQRRAGLAAAVAGIASLVAACGGGGSSATAGSTVYQSALAYAECMRSHGYPQFPDPDSLGNFLSSPAHPIDVFATQYVRGNQECQHLLPNGGAELPPQLRQQMTEALKMSACVRSHGYPGFPDPTIQGGGVSIVTKGGELPPETLQSPVFQSAVQACQRLTHFGSGPQ